MLALAGIDAAVFGFAPGGLFVLEGFSLGAVSIGAIAAGLGLVYDAWFLVLYSGANGSKFLVSPPPSPSRTSPKSCSSRSHHRSA